jgi:outer membrane protein insertion porin family
MHLSPVWLSVMAIASLWQILLAQIPSDAASPNSPPPDSGQPSNPSPPTTLSTPENARPNTTPKLSEPKVLVAEVLVKAEIGELSQELQNQAYKAIRTQAGQPTTRTQLREDINAIFATGFFSNVQAKPEDTPVGVRVTFFVQPNPVLTAVRVQANAGTGVPSVLPQSIVDKTFHEQYGSILNLRRLQEGIQQLNKWYRDNGYVLAQAIDTPQTTPDGTVTLSVAEGVVEDVRVHFRNKEGDDTDDRGHPLKGRTRQFVIKRELELKPGQVFNRNTVQKDLQRVYKLGLFEDVNVSLNPGQDPRQVIVVLNVDERNTGSVGLSGGLSSANGIYGGLSYQQQNLGGKNQSLGAEAQVGQREVLFDVRFTDPWIAGDPYRTSYTVNGFRRKSISLNFDGGKKNVDLPNGDRPRVLRLGSGISFTRPLSKNPLYKSEWTASTGLEYQRVSIRDANGKLSPKDELGNNLSFSGEGKDDLLTLELGAVNDRRNDSLQPTNGSIFRFGIEQSLPVGLGSIFLNRLRANYSQYIPVKFISLVQGPQTLAFNLQAGTVLGDLPPYEAFSLGGSNSVRGYGEGELGSGRSFVQAAAEYRFPIFSILNGALFVDAASDLGSASSVPGNPAGEREKPGSGFGYGLGVRVQSPLGLIRIDYGLSDRGDNRINFGIGERF